MCVLPLGEEHVGIVEAGTDGMDKMEPQLFWHQETCQMLEQQLLGH